MASESVEEGQMIKRGNESGYLDSETMEFKSTTESVGDLLPASEMMDRELVELALEGLAYPDRANECRDEILKRLATRAPQPVDRESTESGLKEIQRRLTLGNGSERDTFRSAYNQGLDAMRLHATELLAAAAAQPDSQPAEPELTCYCKTFVLGHSRAYLDSLDFVHTEIACPDEKLTESFALAATQPAWQPIETAPTGIPVLILGTSGGVSVQTIKPNSFWFPEPPQGWLSLDVLPAPPTQPEDK